MLFLKKRTKKNYFYKTAHLNNKFLKLFSQKCIVKIHSQTCFLKKPFFKKYTFKAIFSKNIFSKLIFQKNTFLKLLSQIASSKNSNLIALIYSS